MRATIFALFVVLVTLIPSSVQAANLVAIIAANTVPYENNRGRDHDVDKIMKEIEKISQNIQLEINYHIYVNEEYNSEILEKLDHIQIHNDDVVIFYYTGHGYREHDKDKISNPWPNLHIGLEGKGIDHYLITQLLESKQPKLLLSLVSCCNKETSCPIDLICKEFPPSDFLEVDAFQENFTKDNYRKLFLETSGVIISSSSLPGEYSYRSPSEGTLYLDAFIEALHEETENNAVCDWISVFEKTIDHTRLKSKGKQTPQYTFKELKGS